MNARCWALTGSLCSLLGCVEQIELAPARGEAIVLDAVPPDAIARLEAAEVKKPEPMLSLSYPSDGCAIPENLAPLRFVFAEQSEPKPMPMPMMKPMKAPASGYRAYELRLSWGESRLSLYTTQTEASVPVARWRALLAEHVSELTITLRALAGPDRVVESRPIHVSIASAMRAGSVRYWSEPSGVALAADVEADADALTEAQGYPTLEPWQSTSADGTKLAVMQDGVLEARSDGTALPTPWAVSLRADTPSWSAAGEQLVFAQSPAAMLPMMPMMPMSEPEMALSGVYRAALLDAATFGEPELLISSDKADEVLRAPTFSPDGQWVAYELQRGRDQASTIALVPAEGGPAQRLDSKSGWKGEGSLPTWIPAAEADHYWLVFSQARTPAATAKADPDQLQLWAVALQRGSAGSIEVVGDPFWLPWQHAEDRNQRALFSEP